jgi:transcriptional regulator with GAF, ATPase, and Fis domain
MAYLSRVTTSAWFWGRGGGFRIPPADACFFCGRRRSVFCPGCYAAICSNCETPERRRKLEASSHVPEAHRRFAPADGASLRAQLEAALDQNEWNVSCVARVLGLARRTIYLRMDRYGIRRPGAIA